MTESTTRPRRSSRLAWSDGARDAVAYACLRAAVGVAFACFGLAKFAAGRAAFVAHMDASFAGSPLPHASVHLFGIALPFLEVGLGLLLALGIATRLTLSGLGLLLVALVGGKAIVQDADTVAHNLIYAVLVYILLTRAEHDAFAVDRLWHR